MARITTGALLGLLCVVLSLPAHAQRKTDVVTLYNGDRITGEVKTLDGGILRLSTDSMGTVDIEWQEIASLQSEFFYEIRLGDGTRYLGGIEASDRPGQLLVSDLDGNHPVDWLQVVTIRPIEDEFLDQFDIYFAAGYSYTRASSVAETSVNTTITYENQDSLNTLTGRATMTDSDNETTSASKVDLDRAVWTDHRHVFRSTFANYETNDELELEHRVGVGAGLGRFFVETYQKRLAGVAGLQVITEKSKATGEDQDLELYLSSRFQAWRFNTPELNLDFVLNLYPSLTDSGRLRSSSDLRLRWELIEDLFFDITAYGSYDNKAEANNDIDYGVTTGLGWEY